MQAWEWVAIGYFAYLTALAPRARSARAAATVVLGSLAVIATTIAVAWLQPAPPLSLIRLWLPAVAILIGYALSGCLFRAPMPEWEARFARIDRRILHQTGRLERVRAWPRPVLEALELSYFACPALIPAGCLLLGWSPGLDAAERYWTPVVLSQFIAFGTLPWIQTRPPRALEAPWAPREPILASRLTGAMVRHATIGANTFPSGHVAASLTVAMVTARVHPWIGAALLLVACVVTLASVVGRYHYGIDAAAGAVVAVVSVTLSTVLA